MPPIPFHVWKYLRDSGISHLDYSGNLMEMAGNIYTDLLFLLTDQFDFKESHDIGKHREFVRWAEERDERYARFGRGMIKHVEDDSAHESPVFGLLVRKLSKKVGEIVELDVDDAYGIAHNGVEFLMLDAVVRSNPHLPSIALEAVRSIDLDESSEVVGEFYGKDPRRLRERLSVIEELDSHFFRHPAYFVRTLASNIERMGDVKDDNVNRVLRRALEMGEDFYDGMAEGFSKVRRYRWMGPRTYDFILTNRTVQRIAGKLYK